MSAVIEGRGRDSGSRRPRSTISGIRSNTTDEIACWFIDSDYNEESLVVHHAYFTSAEPYKKLQRVLKG